METKEFMDRMCQAVEEIPCNVTTNFNRNYGEFGRSVERIVIYICGTLLAAIYLAS